MNKKRIRVVVRHPLGKISYRFDKKNSQKIKGWLAAAAQPTAENKVHRRRDAGAFFHFLKPVLSEAKRSRMDSTFYFRAARLRFAGNEKYIRGNFFGRS